MAGQDNETPDLKAEASEPGHTYDYRLELEDATRMPRSLPNMNVVVWSQYLQCDRERTYQSYDPEEYNLPNDAYEQKRLDTQHAVWRMILDDRLGIAPIEDPDNILDIGTGTGAWAIDFAFENPLCHVVGTDLSLKQISDHHNNCEFLLENSETRDWAFEDPFDYIHLRAMGPCFSDIQVVFRKAYEFLKPGGWIEIQDSPWTLSAVDDSLEGSSLQQWYQLLLSAGAKVGRQMDKIKQCKRLLDEAGYTNVVEEIIPCPGGPWPKDRASKYMGILTANAVLGLLDSYRKFILDAEPELPPEKLDDLSAKAKAEIRGNRVRWFFNIYVVYGQKPEH